MPKEIKFTCNDQYGGWLGWRKKKLKRGIGNEWFVKRNWGREKGVVHFREPQPQVGEDVNTFAISVCLCM